MFKVTLKGFDKLSRDLERLAKQAVPHAMRNALNDAAFDARRKWTGKIGEKLILRNTWTTRTIRVDKARGINPKGMKAEVGSTQAYMVKQEFGGVQRGSVATSVASGEGRHAPPRKKLVRKANKMASIALGQRYRRGNRKQRNAVALHMAAKTGKKFVFLETAKRKGLFKLIGGKRIQRVDMVWDTTSKSHRVPPHPTLGPALREVERDMPRIMTRALIDQLKRRRLMGF